jgi:predicted enzyme related to lactoylglutathione lyase
MPLRDSTPIGAPCWIDLATSDPDRSREFYDSLFGWQSESAGPDYGGYINFTKNGRPVAGAMANNGQMGPDGWSVYLASASAKTTADDAAASGGQVVLPPMDVMDLGVMAIVADSGGGMVGIWQPGAHVGFGVVAEAGAPSWFELHTRDYDAAVAFYRDVFHWPVHTESDTAEFRYTTYGQGDTAVAGIMDASAFLPEGVPAQWSIYFGVESADAALGEITKLGGAVMMGAEDTPYGRLATATDPTGAVFKIVQSPAA